MEHVVFFPAHDSSTAFRRVPSLEEAVRLVEHLRNVEGIDEVSCHALTEVPLAFRAYYRVEIPGVADGSAPAESTVAAESQQVPGLAEDGASPPFEAAPAQVHLAHAEATSPAETGLATADPAEPELAVANGRSPDGATSLGFFA